MRPKGGRNANRAGARIAGTRDIRIGNTAADRETAAIWPAPATGLDADIITSYNGMFEEEKFLQQLGDALHMDSARSEYRSVTDVTFSTERYAGEADANKIFTIFIQR